MVLNVLVRWTKGSQHKLQFAEEVSGYNQITCRFLTKYP